MLLLCSLKREREGQICSVTDSSASHQSGFFFFFFLKQEMIRSQTSRCSITVWGKKKGKEKKKSNSFLGFVLLKEEGSHCRHCFLL